MKICLSGVTRKSRLDLLLESGCPNIVLDYSVAKSLDRTWFENNRSRIDWFMLEYDLSAQWSRVKYLWESSGDRVDKQIAKHGSLELAQEFAISSIQAKVSDYLVFASEYQVFFDVLWLPYLPTYQLPILEHKILKEKVGYPLQIVFNNFSDLVVEYNHIGIGSWIEDNQSNTLISSNIALLKSFNTKVHRLGRVDKETVLTGLFYSLSSSNWISGSKHGVTFEYVGNLKLTTFHGSKGSGKSVRNKLKSKCETLGLDHSLLLSDDKETVDKWNISQWVALTKDVSQVSGYWTPRKDDMSKDQLPTIQKQTNQSLATRDQFQSYLRNCNSCYLSANCPAFEADSSCSLSITPKVETPDDIQNLLNKVIQIQGERVLFASMSEQVQNVGLNPEVSKEMETLTKLIKDSKEIMSPGGGDEVLIKAKGSGVISRLFGGYGKSGGSSKPSTSERIIDVSPMDDDNE